jgi:cystathionine beta-lyase/cystathionine gamma-synthase
MLSRGTHVVVTDDSYRRTRQFLNQTLPRYGVEVSTVPAGDYEALEDAIRPTTRVLISESPTNPYNRILDLERFADIGRRHRVKTVIDATFATPYNQRPIEWGVDVVIHSATKYLGGHDDVTLGLVISAREQAHRALWKHTVDLGFAADPFAAWLTLRGLKTLPLRMDRHCANAAHLARKLAAHPAVTRVHWPGLPDHPDHDTARRLLAGFGGMVAFDLAGGREAGLAFVTGLRLAALAPSLGGAETLVLHPASTSHRQMDAATLRASGIGEGTVRVSVGLEHPDDLWADFEQALAAG